MRVERQMALETLAVHGGQFVDPTTKARAVPLYQTAAYGFDNTAHAARLFNLEEEGNIYTRIGNPTTAVFEERVSLLEGGVGAVATASGHAAILMAILNIAEAGDEIVSASSLYGGTHNLFAVTLPKLGIKVRFVDARDPENFRRASTPKTKAFYAETIGNPGMDVLDIEKVGRIAHENGIPLIIDNTFATPVLCRPLEWGADVVIHSATKFLGGHGTSIGGIVIDGGCFDWTNGKFPGLTEPDLSYHGIRYVADTREKAYVTKLRVQLLRDLGSTLSPFNAFLFLLGLETLHVRMERHVENALAIAGFLENHPAVAWVNYPSLASHSAFELAQKYLPQGAGAVFTFGIQGGRESGGMFIDAVRLFSHLANVGDAKSLVIHPASTTHGQLSPEEQAAAGVTPDMIRLSIGIENLEDLKDDLRQALEASQAS